MRVVQIGQMLSPTNDMFASAHFNTDSNGITLIEGCGDSTFGRYDEGTGIAIAGTFDGVGSTLDMSGIKGDAVSSQTACKAVISNLDRLNEVGITRQLYHSSLAAHFALANLSQQKKIHLSTTATYGPIFPNGNAYILNSGDSRAYVFDGHNLNMLTLDDRNFGRINGLHESFKQLYTSLLQTPNPSADIAKFLELCQGPPEQLWSFLDQKITFRDISELNLLLGFQEEFSNLKLRNHAELTSTEYKDRVCGIFRAAITNRGNEIVRYIGSDSLPLVSITKTHLREGDILLFCTDGLTDVLPTDDIKKQINEYKDFSAGLIARSLVNYAREVVREETCYYSRKKNDEIGAVVVKWGKK